MFKAGDKFKAHLRTFAKTLGHSLESKNVFFVMNRSKHHNLGYKYLMFLEHSSLAPVLT